MKESKYCPHCGTELSDDYIIVMDTVNDEAIYLCPECEDEVPESERVAGRVAEYRAHQYRGVDPYDMLSAEQQDMMDRQDAWSERYEMWRNEY